MTKNKWKKRLFIFFLLTLVVVAFVEFEKWMKRRAEPCLSGICPIPHDHGLVIDPFPPEIVPQQPETSTLQTESNHFETAKELKEHQEKLP